MSSANKTPNLGLNDWDASDKPKREDFNSDNALIDTLLGGHILNESLHCTSEQKALWNAPYIMESYFGTDAASRTINCGFSPRAVIIYTHNRLPVEYNASESKHYVYSGMATNAYFSLGISLTSNGFTVLQGTSELNSGVVNSLNKSGLRYIYLAIK